MISYATDNTFDELTSTGVVLVDFYSENCGPCKALAKVLEELDQELPFAQIVKADVAQCPEAAASFGILGVPAVCFFKDGQVTEHFLGMRDPGTLKRILSSLMYG